MAATPAPDAVASFEINPGTLLQLLETRPETGPRLKCFQGEVSLVSPGRPHETNAARVDYLILAVSLQFGIKFTPLESTTWFLPEGAEDTAYEADRAYYIQNFGTKVPDHPPDLAVEVVVSHPETKALRAGAFLKIPEMWVLDLPKHQLTFNHLAARGKAKATYRPAPRSKAFPMLSSAEVLERLDDPTEDATEFLRNCQAWVANVVAPRHREGGQ